MAIINDLIAQIEDEGLRQRIDEELKRLLKQKKFGLVFEEHQPEGLTEGPVYPYLQMLDQVSRAPGDKLWHALIESDNYYALQLLVYLYAGMVDCIYIDPPYNTGARDWKYNNDYVDSSDQYRHSKWLSMRKRRLKLAKKLLNPKDSVLIVTIDEKEYLHLGCLLEEMFPEARMQMVTSVINPKGSSRKDLFARNEEYLYYLFFGNAHVVRNENDMLHPVEKRSIRWAGLLRSGEIGKRVARPNLFYP
ncbi:MAG: site-specific DNA-methyltransferase, partial [Bacteroidales bacterium]|nr:site-specific DNA-methyltransferase [Bacteroidales bacterium]